MSTTVARLKFNDLLNSRVSWGHGLSQYWGESAYNAIKRYYPGEVRTRTNNRYIIGRIADYDYYSTSGLEFAFPLNDKNESGIVKALGYGTDAPISAITTSVMLDGVDDYIQLPDDIAPGNIKGYMKFEIDFKPAEDPSRDMTIIRYGGLAVNYPGIKLWARTAGRIRMDWSLSSDGGSVTSNPNPLQIAMGSLTANNWYSVTAEVNASAGEASLSLYDGDTTTTVTATSIVGEFDSPGDANFTRIGNYSNEEYFYGRVRNASIWESNTKKEAEWLINEGFGTTINDSENSWDATLNIKPESNANLYKAWNESTLFLSNNPYASLGYNQFQFPTDLDEYTLSFWTQRETITLTADLFSGGSNLEAYVEGDDYKFTTNAGTLTVNTTDSGEWHHIALQYDGTTLSAFLDGTYDSSIAKAAEGGDYNFIFGSSESTDAYSKMNLMHVLLYNRILSQTEIESTMNSRGPSNYNL